MSRSSLKALCLVVVTAVLMPVEARAQNLSGGILGGVALASLANEDGPSERRIGLRVGGFLDVDVTSSLGARVEAAYAMKGVKSADSDVTVALDYIEIPALATLTLPGSIGPMLFAGPAIGIKVTSELRTPAGDTDYGDLVRPVDFGVAVGAGLSVGLGSRDVLVEVRYTRGLRSVFDFGDPSDSDSDDKNEVISAGVAVSLF
jgi:hypothetical protein